jgi:Ca-activated chloride channel homolog
MDVPAPDFSPARWVRRVVEVFPMRGFSSRVLFPSAVAAAGLSVMLQAQAPQTAPPQQPTFRSGASTVAVYATVTDGSGRLVTNLTRDDFEVYDNGKLQPLTLFAAESQPISIAIMLDRSGSMRENNALVLAAAEEFVRKLLPHDRARIGTFAEKIHLDPEEFTSDQRQLIEVLRGELQREGPTPLWNASMKAMSALAEQDGRRVVLLFTDGVDTPPVSFKTANASVMDVVDRATRDDMMVYAIGLESRMPFGRRQSPMAGGFGGGFGNQSSGGLVQRPDPGLPKIAEETGGGYFELTRADDLKATFARVADELHQQYALGFEPAKLDGKRHDLEVKVKGKGKGMKVRTRQNYVAGKRTSN